MIHRDFGRAPDLYSSHIPVLAACLGATDGSVLELGAGLYSTPMLHGFCGAAQRQLVTIEGRREWLYLCSPYVSDTHLFFSGLDLDELAKQSWSVVFVDGDSWSERAEAVYSLIVAADLVVVHDTQERECVIDWSRVARKVSISPAPWPVETTVASNRKSLDFLISLFPGQTR